MVVSDYTPGWTLADKSSRRLRCPRCGWEWIGPPGRCMRCDDDPELRAKMRRNGWAPSVYTDSIELFSPAGAFLGAVAFKESLWHAFTSTAAGVLPPCALLPDALRSVELAVGYVALAPVRARWRTVEATGNVWDDAPGEELVAEGEVVLGRVLRRGRRIRGYSADHILLVERSDDVEAVRRLLATILRAVVEE